MNDDIIYIGTHTTERVYYDPAADFWARVAASDELSPEASVRLMKQAEAIYRRARAFAPRTPGSVNVRTNVVDVLRRIGGAS